MNIEINENVDYVAISISGRLDINNAGKFEEEVIPKINKTKNLIIDCDNLEYISSAGLRSLLQFQKMMTEEGKLKIINVNRDIYEIFETTGFTDILNIEKALKKISVDGCEVIGSGLCGECYKIDEETILKLYFEEYSGEMVDCEKKYAKAAFVQGIPTAISYDMVRCGKRRGLLFEMLNARTFNTVIAEDIENIDKYAKMFADLALQVHSQKGNSDVFRNYDEFYKSFIPKMKWFSDEECEAISKMFDIIPKGDTCVHGDFTTANVMYQDGKLLFIDMGDFSIGSGLYDVAQVYTMCMKEFKNKLNEQIMKINKDNRKKFFYSFMKEYYHTNDEKEIEQKIKEVRRVDCIRQMFYIYNFEATRDENIAYVKEILAENNLIKY